MTASLQELLERADLALSKHENSVARAALESALPLVTAPHERALALNGLAILSFRSNEDERALDLLDRAIAECLPAPNAATPDDGRVRCALAEVWHEKAMLLIGLHRKEGAIEIINELLRRFLDISTSSESGDQDTVKLRRVVARALGTKGTLHMPEQFGDALECCEEVIRRFQGYKDLGIQKHVAKAMRRRAWLFGHLGRQDKEIEGYDEVILRFAASQDWGITETVLDALESKMQIYRDQEDFQMVIEICDQIIQRYGQDSYWKIANTVARTMIRQAVAFGRRGAGSRELAAYDNVVRLYGDSPEMILRIHAAKALMFKAVTLNDADQSAAEMECYEEVLRRYADDPDEEVRVVAADALIHKGFSLGAIAEDAAEDTGTREIEAEIACYDEAVSRYGEEEFIGLRRAVAEALLHKGETLAEVGRAREAVVCLEAVIAGYSSADDKDLGEIVRDARALMAQI